MIRHTAREREAGFGNVEAGHRFLDLAEATATGGKARNGLHRAFGCAEEVGVEGEDDVGLFEIVVDRRVARPRLVLGPEELRELLLDKEAQTLARGRGAGLRQDGETFAAGFRVIALQDGKFLPEIFPIAFGIVLAALGDLGLLAIDFDLGIVDLEDGLGAVRIVEIKHGGLAKNIGRAIEAGHIRIAFQLGRAAIVGGGDERNGSAAADHRGRIMERLAGDLPLDTLAVRDDMKFRTAAAREAKAGERKRGTHELHEPATGHFIAGKLGGTLGKFPFETGLEVRGLRVLFQTAPVGLAGLRGGRVIKLAFHRWHPAQSLGGLILSLSTSSRPNLAWVVPEGTFQSRSKIGDCSPGEAAASGRTKFSGLR